MKVNAFIELISGLEAVRSAPSAALVEPTLKNDDLVVRSVRFLTSAVDLGNSKLLKSSVGIGGKSGFGAVALLGNWLVDKSGELLNS